MRLKKITYSFFATIIMLLFLGACSKNSNGNNQKNSLNWDEENKIQTLDPAQAIDQASLTTLNSTMEGLFRTGTDSRAEPGIAKKVTNSKNKKEYTFYLRDAQWSNGEPVIAQDFVYAWRRAAAPQTNSPYAYMFKNLYNGKDVVEGLKPVKDLGVRAVGDKKLVVKLQNETPYLNEMLGFPVFFPLNKKSIDNFSHSTDIKATSLIYNGPFKLTQVATSRKNWRIEKNENYWDKKFVKLAKVDFQTNIKNNYAYKEYRASKLDRVPLNLTEIKKLKNKSTIEHKTATVVYLQYNQNKAQFKNRNIRRAISLAVNRKKLVKDVLGDGSKVAESAFPTGTFHYWNSEFNKQAKLKRAVKSDNKKAKKLWKKGLDEEHLSNLKIRLLADNSDKNQQTAKFVAKQLESKLPNAKVVISSNSVEDFRKMATNGDFDIVLSSHNAEFRDPITFLNLYTVNSPLNDGSWHNSEYDKLVDDAMSVHASEPQKRWNDMIQAEMILMNEQGVAPLYEKGETILLNKQASGIVYKPVGVGYDFKRAHIK